jgi:hypothetical protein
MVGDGKKVGNVGAQAAEGDRPAGEYLLRPTIVAYPAVNQRSQKCKLVGNTGVPRQELTELQARNASGDWPIRAAIFTRSSRLGIVCFQVAGAAVTPDHDECVSPAASGTRACAQAEQVREAKASDPSQTQA